MVRPLTRDSGKLEFQNFCRSIADGPEEVTYPISTALRRLNIKIDDSNFDLDDEDFLSKQHYRAQLKKEAEAHHHRDVAKTILKVYDNLPDDQKGLQLDSDTAANNSAAPSPPATAGVDTRSAAAQAAEAAELAETSSQLKDIRRTIDLLNNKTATRRIYNLLSDDLKLSFQGYKSFYNILIHLQTIYDSPTAALDVKLKMLEMASKIARGNDIKILLDSAKKAGFVPDKDSDAHKDLRTKFDAALGWSDPLSRGVFPSVTEAVKQKKIAQDISLIDFADKIIALEDEERRQERHNIGISGSYGVSSQSIYHSSFTSASLNNYFNPKPPSQNSRNKGGGASKDRRDLRDDINRSKEARRAGRAATTPPDSEDGDNRSPKTNASDPPSSSAPDGSTYLAGDRKIRCTNCTKEANGPHNAMTCTSLRAAGFNSRPRNIAILIFDENNDKGRRQEEELRQRCDSDPSLERPARFAWADAAAANANLAEAADAAPHHADTYFVSVNEDNYSRVKQSIFQSSTPNPSTQTPKPPSSAEPSRRSYAEAVLDTGCGPDHIISSTADMAPGHSPSSTIIHAATFSSTVNTNVGKGILRTTDLDGNNVNMSLPGNSRQSSSFPRTLVSANALVKSGCKMNLGSSSGSVTTPNGVKIPIRVKGGIYVFPSQKRVDHSSQAISFHNAFDPLQSATIANSSPATALPPMLLSNDDLDKLDIIHQSLGHCRDTSRMLSKLRDMRLKNAQDQDLPSKHPISISDIQRWKDLRPCTGCQTGTAKRPPQRSTHPPLPPTSYLPGESLQIDASGSFPSTTLLGNNQAFILTDKASKCRWSFATKNKDQESCLEIIKTYIAHSPVVLRDIRTDNEFVTKSISKFCADNKIKLSSCAPNSHHSNGIAERAVALIKEAGRAGLIQAGLNNSLIDVAYECAAQQLSYAPSKNPIMGKIQSPSEAWPTAPFLHPSLKRGVFGSLAFGHTGKQSDAPNTGKRALPGIYVGHNPLSTGIRIFHSDSKSIQTYAHVQLFPLRFPYREQMFSGERPGTLADRDWRQSAIHPARILPDADVANFAVGKQLQVPLPQSMFPTYPGKWHAMCQGVYNPQVPASLSGVTAVRMIFTAYDGSTSDLSTTDRQTLRAFHDPTSKLQPQEIFLPISTLSSKQKLPKDNGRDHWFRYHNAPHQPPPSLRDILKQAYPNARTLADYAYESVGLCGYYPSHDVLADTPLAPMLQDDARDTTAPEPSITATSTTSPPNAAPDSTTSAVKRRGRPPKYQDDPSNANVQQVPKPSSSTPPKKAQKTHASMRDILPKGQRVILPARKISSNVRAPKATWNPSKSQILPTRQRLRSHVPPAAPDLASKPPSSADPLCSASPSAPRRILRSTPQGVFIVNTVGYEPRSVQEARKLPTWSRWEKAIDKEFSGLIDRETWEEVPDTTKIPSDAQILPTKIVLKLKPGLPGMPDTEKARLVVRGDMENPKPPASETYASTPSATEIRTVFALATQRGWKISSLDISQAFLQAEPLSPDTHIYIRPPSGYDLAPPGTVWRLKRHLYGTSRAPRAWQNTLTAFLQSYGFSKINCSDTVWKWTDGTRHLHLVVWVDDILLSSSHDSAADDFKTALFSRFQGTDDGPVRKYVGLYVSRSPDLKTTHISQEPLIRELLERSGMQHCTPVLSPMEPGTLLKISDRPAVPDPKRRQEYQEQVGSLLYLSVYTRPDLCFAVNQLAKHMSNPGEVHWTALRRCLRYLKGTATFGITYKSDDTNPDTLTAYADADWAACTETRRSYMGYLFMLAGGALAWKSSQYKAVTTSTAESEYVSASKASDEIVWLRRVLAEAGAEQRAPTTLFEDNRACRMLSENPVQSRARHIDFRIMSLRERVTDGTVKVVDCPTHDMHADPMTKNLNTISFQRHRDVMLGTSPATSPTILPPIIS